MNKSLDRQNPSQTSQISDSNKHISNQKTEKEKKKETNKKNQKMKRSKFSGSPFTVSATALASPTTKRKITTHKLKNPFITRRRSENQFFSSLSNRAPIHGHSGSQVNLYNSPKSEPDVENLSRSGVVIRLADKPSPNLRRQGSFRSHTEENLVESVIIEPERYTSIGANGTGTSPQSLFKRQTRSSRVISESGRSHKITIDQPKQVPTFPLRPTRTTRFPRFTSSKLIRGVATKPLLGASKRIQGASKPLLGRLGPIIVKNGGLSFEKKKVQIIEGKLRAKLKELGVEDQGVFEEVEKAVLRQQVKKEEDEKKRKVETVVELKARRNELRKQVMEKVKEMKRLKVS